MKNTFTDPHFGSLRELRDGQEYLLEKDLLLAEKFRVTLCLVSSERAVLPHQYPLFQEIAANFSLCLKRAETLYLRQTGQLLLSAWQPEMITLPGQSADLQAWEFDLVRVGGFEHCLIDFSGLEAVHISFQA